jgi:hypothetical protein
MGISQTIEEEQIMAHGRRMSTRMYLAAFTLCVYRDGERCAKCGWEPGMPPTKIQKKYPIINDNLQRLELDHCDGNPWNNPADGSNWALLCRTCNVMKGVEQRGEGERVEVGKRLTDAEAHDDEERVLRIERGSQTRRIKQQANYLSGDTSLKANAISEPAFRDYCVTRVFREGQVEKNRLLSAGAEVSGCHPKKTATYYLEKMTSDEGMLAEVESEGEIYIVMRSSLHQDDKPKRGRPRKK